MTDTSRRLVPALGLSRVQVEEIRALAAACNAADGIAMRLNERSLERRPADQTNDFLYYDGAKLIGFLGLYVFNPREAECSAMTHPAYRRQGIFGQLVAAAAEELQERDIPAFVFFCDRNSTAAAPVMERIGARYEYTEYLMEAFPERVQLQPIVPGLALRPATQHDLPVMSQLDSEAFGVPPSATVWLQGILADPTQHLWAITVDGEFAGKIQGRASEDGSHIYGFAMQPARRGRGYGKAALSEVMRRLLAERWQAISLEVAAANDHALGLYRSRGFEVVTAYDYYRLLVANG